MKLNKFLVNGLWMDKFPRLLQNNRPRLGSDHAPIRLKVGGHFSKPRCFRFELVWLATEGFRELVQQWWVELKHKGCGAFVLSKKLATLRDRLRI